MSAEYSAGRVLYQIGRMQVANRDDLEIYGMLTAYAERIEADERAVLGTCALHGDDPVGDCRGCAMTLPEKDFTHPPAQAAQSEWENRALLAEELCRAYKVQIETLATHPHSPDAADSGRVDVRSAVVKALGGYLERHWPDNPVSYDDMADHITRAIGSAQAEGE